MKAEDLTLTQAEQLADFAAAVRAQFLQQLGRNDFSISYRGTA